MFIHIRGILINFLIYFIQKTPKKELNEIYYITLCSSFVKRSQCICNQQYFDPVYFCKKIFRKTVANVVKIYQPLSNVIQILYAANEF